MIKKAVLLILTLSIYSCESVKNALTGKKYESSDEFLVIKKNPLVLPPDFDKLPQPNEAEIKSRTDRVEEEIDDILSSIKKNNQDIDKIKESAESKSTEDFILDKIKNK
tara:strand:+ start:5010 stop:5336 length:327 start_codon:yes stop_codon:yes gene_type:complete